VHGHGRVCARLREVQQDPGGPGAVLLAVVWCAGCQGAAGGAAGGE